LKGGHNFFLNMAFHPEIDGQTKWVNGVLKHYFKNYVSTNKRDWGKLPSLAKFC
jgi:hypothetical protein